MEGLDGEGEGGDEVFEDGDHELLGDAADGSKVLELRDFVDDVDDVGALLSVQVAEMHGVDAQEAGLAVMALGACGAVIGGMLGRRDVRSSRRAAS